MGKNVFVFYEIMFQMGVGTWYATISKVHYNRAKFVEAHSKQLMFIIIRDRFSVNNWTQESMLIIPPGNHVRNIILRAL